MKKNRLNKTQQIRYLIFLKDVFVIAITGFGGPQMHLAMFIKKFVEQRNYLTEAELMELQSLCQLLPGPTSTQTITAIGFRLGKANLAYFTLLVWVLPSTILMGIAAIGVAHINTEMLISMTHFIKPMGIAFVFFAAYSIGRKVITTKTSVVLLLLATFIAYVFRSPYVAPVAILLGGLTTSFKFKQQQKTTKKQPFRIAWGNFFLWAGVFLFVAVLGGITQSLPIRLFENFYRNGSLAFGGGHILKPLLYNEFVAFKHYLTRDEFLSGIAIAELIPGPTFSIAAFVGSLSMRSDGLSSQLLGTIIASIGIFLPGAFLIFFTIRFWEQLKQFRGIRASLEGINAASTGLTLAAALSLSEPMMADYQSIFWAIGAFIVLLTNKVPPYLLILAGLVLGVLMSYF